SCAASSPCSVSAITTRPPDSTGKSSSSTVMSNAKVDSATNRSWGPRPYNGHRAAISWAMAPWVTLTAFGRPVDPEVKIVSAVPAHGGGDPPGQVAHLGAGQLAVGAGGDDGVAGAGRP